MKLAKPAIAVRIHAVPATALKEMTIMSEAENAALVRRWFDEVWNERRDATVHELLHPEAVGHLEGLVSHGVNDFLSARAFILRAFPDFHIVVEETAAQGDNVVVRWSANGSHGGDFLGVAATGAPVSFRGITWMRLSAGRLLEGWDVWNQGRVLDELRAQAGHPPG